MMTERKLVTWAGSLRLNPSPQADDRILAAAMAAIDRTLTPSPIYKSIARLAVTAAALIGIAVLAWHLIGTSIRSNRSTPPAVVTSMPLEPNHATSRPVNKAEQLAKELVLAEQQFNKKDVDSLMDLLENGLYQTKIMVAGYLSELNAPQTLPILQRLAAAWTGDPNANPFTQAMARIKPVDQEPNHPPAGQSVTKAPASPTDRILRFQVIDKATGQPQPDTLILKNGKTEHTCDANGCCQINVGDDKSLEVGASKPGYVAMSMEFQFLTEEVLSQTHLFALDRGITIGGIFQDANGLPIEGVIFWISLSSRPDGTNKPFVNIYSELHTDVNGRWYCDTMPADLVARATAGEFGFNIAHPDYVHQGLTVTDPSAVAALKEQDYRITLYEGYTLSGRVVNEKGQPIGGAKVNSSITESDGTFVIRHMDPDPNHMQGLRVQAEGYLPTSIGCRPDMEDVEVVLQRGTWQLSGRVVDTEGKPLTNAEIHVVNGPRYHIRRSTDAEGRYLTGSLPVPIGIMNVQVSIAGFMQTFRIVERPVEEPLDFVLHRELHVFGQVIDALTGIPLDRFRIRACTVDADGKIKPEASTDSGGDGHYKHTFTYFCETGYVIAIEADGYLPAASRVIGINERNPVIDLALTRGTGPAGTVVDVNGLPVVAAWIYAIPENAQAWYWQSLPSPSSDMQPLTPEYPLTKTGEDGRFSFEPIYQLRHIMALADQGICSITVEALERTKVLMLQPWAEVRGTIHTSLGSPVKGQFIEIQSLPEAPVRFGYKWSLSTNTDDQGALKINRVPPGEFTLFGKTYSVAPGQVLNLDLTVDPNAL